MLKIVNALFETVSDIAINLLSSDYTVIWANSGMVANVKRPINELIGKPCYEAFRRRNSPCPVCLLKIVSETKKPLVAERWLDLPDQERQHAEVRAYPIFDRHGSVQYLFEILTLITDKKKDDEKRTRYIELLEKTLRESEAQNSTRFLRQTDLNAEGLTARQREALCLIGKGFSNKQIASVLGVGVETVKTHVKNIFLRIGTGDRAEAAAWAAIHHILM